jgi:hypothetical protein
MNPQVGGQSDLSRVSTTKKGEYKAPRLASQALPDGRGDTPTGVYLTCDADAGQPGRFRRLPRSEGRSAPGNGHPGALVCWSVEASIPTCGCGASMPGFDARQWMRERNLVFPVNDPAVRKEIADLFRRDLSERLPAYAEQSRRNPDRTDAQSPD